MKNQPVDIVQEIISIYSEIYTKHVNKPCGQNREFSNVKQLDT